MIARTSPAPTAPGTMRTRKVRLRYPPVQPLTLSAVVSHYNATVAHYHAAGEVALPPFDSLLEGLPQGCIRFGRVAEMDDGPAISLDLSYSDTPARPEPRFVAPLGFLLFRALTLFQAEAFDGADYQNVSCLRPDIALTRIMANAGPNEVVRLAIRQCDLRPGSLLIEPGRPRALGNREDAIEAALRHHRSCAGPWGLSDLLSREDYEGLIRGCFRLFDHEYGHHFFRPVALGANAPTL